MHSELARDGDESERTLTPVPTGAADSADVEADELLRRAFADPVTGLLGRDAFEDLLGMALARTGRPHPVTVVCLRLQEVDLVEPRFGPPTLAPVAMAAARRLGSTLRPSDPVASVRKDEFAVLLQGLHRHAAYAAAARILNAVRGPRTPTDPASTLRVGAGIAVGQPFQDAPAVLGRAEAAAAWATARGRKEPVPFRPSMSEAPPPPLHGSPRGG